MSKQTEISEEDSNLFRQKIGPVKRLIQNQVITNHRKTKPVQLRQMQDSKESMRTNNDCNKGNLKIHDHEVFFTRSGVQRQTAHKLRRGKYAIEKEIDLHGMTVDNAELALSSFLEMCTKRGYRCIRIIHGKGYGSRNKKPILKIKLNYWLQMHDKVLSFCSAQPSDGGTGAVYVLLKNNRK